MEKTFEKHLEDEIAKYNGISFPVKAGMLQCLLIKKLPCLKLHPNPDDEFSMPGVGPSFRIISEYEKKFRRNEELDNKDTEERIVVEKMHPDGYMIINGHHRWAAYYKIGRKTVPVEVVNLTHDEDIRKMLANANHDRRVTFDLDEVVFCADENEPAEKKPGFPFGSIYKERIRLGIPALFKYLYQRGYDIWVYSSKFYSMDYIGNLMKKYHVEITGIVTGTSKKTAADKKGKKEIDSLLAKKYKYTLHIDRDTVLMINNSTGDFEEYPIDKEKGNWSQGVMDITGDLGKDAGE